MNTEIAAILDELEHAHRGDPWHGPSRTHVLGDITPEEAARHPGGEAHGIWELVLHMHAWTMEVARRLGGAQPGMPGEGDWPAVPHPSAAAWDDARRSLDAAHDQLATLVVTFPPARLDERVGTDRDAPLGTGSTYRAMLHGLAQHDAYHTGQISILVRLYRTSVTPP
jgi:uncharacterized damage-inducible protein DinB